MCRLFGFVDRDHRLTARQKSRITHALAAASEARGTDATGIAYNWRRGLAIYKRPVAGRKMPFYIPSDVSALIGHTRMTTQGNPKHNQNNHPFSGKSGGREFALAHNGILYNDVELRRELNLPKTHIETDSYVAVQFLEHRDGLGFESLKALAEAVFGPFVFTVLDEDDNLYIVKGDNPIELRYYKGAGIYLYASTDKILDNAFRHIPYELGKYVPVPIKSGEIVKLAANGEIDRSGFEYVDPLYCYPYRSGSGHYTYDPFMPTQGRDDEQKEYIEFLKMEASMSGYDPTLIDELLDEGFTLDEVEEFVCCGVL